MVETTSELVGMLDKMNMDERLKPSQLTLRRQYRPPRLTMTPKLPSDVVERAPDLSMDDQFDYT